MFSIFRLLAYHYKRLCFSILIYDKVDLLVYFKGKWKKMTLVYSRVPEKLVQRSQVTTAKFGVCIRRRVLLLWGVGGEVGWQPWLTYESKLLFRRWQRSCSVRPPERTTWRDTSHQNIPPLNILGLVRADAADFTKARPACHVHRPVIMWGDRKLQSGEQLTNFRAQGPWLLGREGNCHTLHLYKKRLNLRQHNIDISPQINLNDNLYAFHL